MSKLYTEEQVKHTLQLMGLHIMINEFIKKAEPIELPSDEEIDILANETFEQNNNIGKILWKDGIKWMKEQIINQTK